MVPRILVIRGGAIGDFILTLPAIKLLREAFPKAHIEILGYQHIVALAEGRYYANAIRSIEYGAMSGFFVPNSELAPDLVEYFASFQQIVSYLFDPDKFFETNLRKAGAQNILPAFVPIDDSEHASRQLARPLQQLALYLEEHAAELFPSSADREWATAFMENYGGGKFIAIHPGSGSGKKNWPLENWAELGRQLAGKEVQARLLIVGGEADQLQVEMLQRSWQGSTVAVARDLPLPHLAALLERCSLFLGHDSGISHIAAAVRIPCLLLFGPTDPQIWAPANPQVQAIEAPDGQLSHITVDDVWREARRMLLDSGADGSRK